MTDPTTASELLTQLQNEIAVSPVGGLLTVNNWILQNQPIHIAYGPLRELRLKPGNRYKSTDQMGRRLVIKHTSFGNVVVYDRHPPNGSAKPCLVLIAPKTVMECGFFDNVNDLTFDDMLLLYDFDHRPNQWKEKMRKTYEKLRKTKP